MSSWTDVTGTVVVNVSGESQPQLRYILETVLAHLPRVSGSEGDMKVYINEMGGTSCSASTDEFLCFTDKTKAGFKTQPFYILSLHGWLRDRTLDETYKSLVKWLCRLAKRVMVKSVTVSVTSYEGSRVINVSDRYGYHKNPFSTMWEHPSWSHHGCNYLGKNINGDSYSEPAWWEFMFPEQIWTSKGCLPISLVYKYISNPNVDAEVERRSDWINKNKILQSEVK